jgi:nicotinate (nicotinamide) nucleotide adenylyltransferase
MKTIALLGGSFNPPGIHHRSIAEKLVQTFDEVFIIPCGQRKDKLVIQEEKAHRVEMVKRAFAGLPVNFDFSDLENNTFTPTIKLDALYAMRGNVWHVVGTDLLMQDEHGHCLIHDWIQGKYFFQNGNFAVIPRKGYVIKKEHMPPQSKIIDVSKNGSSTEIRKNIREGISICGLVSPNVEEYIKEHHLYAYHVRAKIKK